MKLLIGILGKVSEQFVHIQLVYREQFETDGCDLLSEAHKHSNSILASGFTGALVMAIGKPSSLPKLISLI